MCQVLIAVLHHIDAILKDRMPPFRSTPSTAAARSTRSSARSLVSRRRARVRLMTAFWFVKYNSYYAEFALHITQAAIPTCILLNAAMIRTFTDPLETRLAPIKSYGRHLLISASLVSRRCVKARSMAAFWFERKLFPERSSWSGAYARYAARWWATSCSPPTVIIFDILKILICSVFFK